MVFDGGWKLYKKVPTATPRSDYPSIRLSHWALKSF